MKRQIQNLIVVVAIFCIAALGNRALAEDVKGVWKMEMVPNAGVSEIFIVKIDGSIARFYDINNTKIAEGTISENSITAKSIGKTEPVNFKASVVGSIMSGTTFTPDGDKIQWKATKTGGIYKCENHRPAHTATTFEEMELLTKEFQCKGWSKLR